MNGAEIIQKTEEEIWKLISTPTQICEGVIHYSPIAGFEYLNEASKFVIQGDFNPVELDRHVVAAKPRRIRVSPPWGYRFVGSKIAEGLKNILYNPTGDSCLYLYAGNHCEEQQPPSPYQIRELDLMNAADRDTVLNLRSEKIAKQPEPEVQIALRNWTLARLQMRGYQAILLSEAATPIGYVCWFNAEGLTRLRDLFIKEDYQQRRLSKYLLTRVMAMQKAPF